ncbi:hypothetical protein Cni_G02587 [Canna indica]|uniref:Uncharacterized protein n=1 Tax=Canna indica TaxID=4628 RepID=A0AAQ3JQD5_9LILI|nr:hypothetical protein Cni_G02587 [Canna indica]
MSMKTKIVAVANAVAVATALLMITVALDCFVTGAFLGAGSPLHVVPLTRGIVSGSPVLVIGIPCAVLGVACFVKERGASGDQMKKLHTYCIVRSTKKVEI